MKMIAVSLPDPGPFGWGVCGRELTAALGEIASVQSVKGDQTPYTFISPMLHAIRGVDLIPLRPLWVSATRNVGYCFIEDGLAVVNYVPNGKRFYDHIATGSAWCTAILLAAGLPNVSTVIQGVHPDFFEAKDRRPRGAPFTVFTGGKAEFRKGQDVAARALQIFTGRHPDVLVKTCWYNPWPETVMTLQQSKLLPKLSAAASRTDIFVALHEALPMGRTVHYDAMPLVRAEVASLYASTDVGLFPNRCEAGTNLVMMEYMATGKPVIATYATGQKDVLDDGAPLNLLRGEPLLVHHGPGIPAGVWIEPNMEEVVAKLELAYEMRDDLAFESEQNQTRMRQYTWKRCAEQFMELLFP